MSGRGAGNTIKISWLYFPGKNQAEYIGIHTTYGDQGLRLTYFINNYVEQLFSPIVD